MQREKRPRIIRNAYSAFACTTCRARRVKCDEHRPVCTRCRKANRFCHYDRQAIVPNELLESDTALNAVPTRQLVDALHNEPILSPEKQQTREQEMNHTLRERAIRERNASPVGAVDNWSQIQMQFRDLFIEECRPDHNRMPECFTSVLTVADVSPRPLALTTTALALIHAESKQPDGNQQLVYEASVVFGRALADLRRTLIRATKQNPESEYFASTILLTMLLIGLYGEPTQGTMTTDPPLHAWKQHIYATAQYLQTVGPGAFDPTNPSDAAIFHSAMLVNFKTSLFSRRRLVLEQSTSRFLGATMAKSTGMPVELLQWHRIIFPLPGLLEQTDALFHASAQRRGSDCIGLMQKLTKLRQELAHYIRTTLGPLITLTDSTSLDSSIEEHCFLSSESLFPLQYRFPNLLLGVSWIYTWLGCLLADSAALRILYWRIEADGDSDGVASAVASELERAASGSATELCRCIHFLSERYSLTYLHTIDTILLVAGTVFEELGATEESTWCFKCRSASQRRFRRLAPLQPRSLCRVSDVASALAAAVQYRSQKKNFCAEEAIG